MRQKIIAERLPLSTSFTFWGAPAREENNLNIKTINDTRNTIKDFVHADSAF